MAVLFSGSVQRAFAGDATSSISPGTAPLVVKKLKLLPSIRPRTAVPEPATLAMVAIGLAGVGALRRKKAI
jgi:hypothetical protein